MSNDSQRRGDVPEKVKNTTIIYCIQYIVLYIDGSLDTSIWRSGYMSFFFLFNDLWCLVLGQSSLVEETSQLYWGKCAFLFVAELRPQWKRHFLRACKRTFHKCEKVGARFSANCSGAALSLSLFLKKIRVLHCLLFMLNTKKGQIYFGAFE